MASDSHVTIKIDTAQVERMLKAFPVELNKAMTEIYLKGGVLSQREMKLNAPRGVSARGLNETIVFELKNGYVVIHPTKKFGEYDASVVELGRRPGKMPPWTADRNPDFVKWADAKGIPPFALAKSIAEKGTKPTHFVKKTFKTIEPQVVKLANVTIEDFVKKMNRGRF
jgi:hypothetical protein